MSGNYDMIYTALDYANESKQFKSAKLKATIEENIINKEVAILINGKKVMLVREPNITKCYLQIVKWLMIAALPIYNDLNIIIDGDDFKIIPKD